MGRIALSQNLSLDAIMQSPVRRDVPFKYRGVTRVAAETALSVAGPGEAKSSDL